MKITPVEADAMWMSDCSPSALQAIEECRGGLVGITGESFAGRVPHTPPSSSGGDS